MEGIEEKVRKYRALAAKYAVRPLVAVGTHRFTEVTLASLDDVLTGPGDFLALVPSQVRAGSPRRGLPRVPAGPGLSRHLPPASRQQTGGAQLLK